ncbi:MAG: site-specific integrase [Burkholderiaceae bacterium]
MTDENMTKRAAGVHPRSDSSVWQWKIRVPQELRSLYPSEWAHRCSLKTSDLSSANIKAAQLQARWTIRFDEERNGLNPQVVERVTPEMGKLLAERVAARILGMDEKLRNEPETARMLLEATRPFRIPHGLAIGPYEPPSAIADRAPLDPLEGMPLDLLLELGDVNEAINRQAAIQMATQRVAAVLPFVKAEALALGLTFDAKVPGALDALRVCLKAYRKAWQDVTERDAGNVIETPEAPTPTKMKQAKPTFLRDVLPQWKLSKTRRPQTVKAAEKALGLYEEATGNPPIASLTRAQGVDCRNALLDQGVTAKTARDRFDYIKGFLNFAHRELELLTRNPWEGLAIEYTTTSPRRPWSGEQLGTLFKLPLFTAYDIPNDWHAGGDAAYWIPLLGIFTGARVGELCQLEVADIETVDGVASLHITDLGDTKTVKTSASRRLVPVHSELIRLGFLDYVDAIKQAKSTSLWPALKLAPTKPSNYFSAWFKTIRAVEDEKELPDFHSFRHTVRSKLASAGVAEPMIDVLCGHEVTGSTGAKKYTERTIDDKQKALDRVAYSGLSLPKVFASPVHLYAKPKRKSSKTSTFA